MRQIPIGVFLGLAILTGAAAVAGAAAADPMPVFTHGVASGDVTATGALLWTRVDRPVTLKVEVFDDPGLRGRKAFQATVHVTAASDFTARVDATGLRPATTHFYRWRHGHARSDVGTFTTAPAPSEPRSVRFVYTGDSDGTRVGGAPFFNQFEVLRQARLEDPAFFVYLGDTIYGDSPLRPAGPAVALDEYRDAYRENRTIAALPELLAATSTYAQPDDHEVFDDYSGATVPLARYDAGRRAFLEYMPVRDTGLLHDPTCAGAPLFRTFRWGSLVDIIIPDERSCRSDTAAAACAGDPLPAVPALLRQQFGLPPSPPPGCLATIFDPRRTMLGPVQKEAFKEALRASTAKFKFVMSQLAFQQFHALPYDRWEGYASERAEILRLIRDHGIENVIFLSTDTHASLVNEVFLDRFTDPRPVAVELITGPIATFTLEREIFEFGERSGIGGLAAVAGLQAILSLGPGPPFFVPGLPPHVPADCRNLDRVSYGLVEVDAGSGTARVTLKDDAGAPVLDQAPPGGPCAFTFGP